MESNAGFFLTLPKPFWVLGCQIRSSAPFFFNLKKKLNFKNKNENLNK
jgi:hypothetical protein